MAMIDHNQSFLEEEQCNVSPEDRAFKYGDGLFETIRIRGGETDFLNDHFERLQKGCDALQIQLPPCFSKDFLETRLKKLKESSYPDSNIMARLQVWRKAGGTFRPETNESNYLITLRPLSPLPPSKEPVYSYTNNLLVYTPVSRFKTCNALPYIIAGTYANDQGAADVLMLNQHGSITECLVSNIFWVKNNLLHTPSLQTGCVDGIMRKQVFKIAASESIGVKAGAFSSDEIQDAETVFTSNAAGIVPVTELDGQHFPADHPVINKLQSILNP